MERAFSKVGRDRLNPRALDSGASLRGGETFSDLVKAFLNLMVENDEALSMKHVVAATGMSSRTFQRQLKEEGASFSDLLADVRRSETLKRLKERNVTIAAIATDLGYSDQATFTRAFRRWTGCAAELVPRSGELSSRRGTDILLCLGSCQSYRAFEGRIRYTGEPVRASIATYALGRFDPSLGRPERRLFSHCRRKA